MKTDIAQALCIAVTSFFFLSAVVTPTEGKCSGKWAIHACWGGNGKRSDPSMDEGSNPSLLRQLLLRDSPAYPSVLDSSMEEVPAQTEDFGSSFNADYPEYRPLPPASLNRFAALLRTLRSLQKESDSLP